MRDPSPATTGDAAPFAWNRLTACLQVFNVMETLKN
jgi:hypothetical protein